MRMFRTGLVLGLLLAASACDSTETSTPATSVTTTVVDATTSTSVAPATSEPTTTAPPSSTTTPPTATTPPTVPTETTSPPTTAAPATVDVKVYLLRDERLVSTHRDVLGPAVLRAALEELLTGPTVEEADAGLFTIVPIGTELRDLNLVDGLATVDLSSEFESGGGSLSMVARVGQIVFTATQFENVDRVEFWLDGEPVDAIGGEGVMVDEPLTRADIDRYITGSVIIDTPAYGSTVRSPFTVTGEGDVFEGQFPIEVWANGDRIGGITPVTAGAWGNWADFEVTITLDAPPGPIELITYDPGGCGDGPECPEIIETIVPLTLTN